MNFREFDQYGVYADGSQAVDLFVSVDIHSNRAAAVPMQQQSVFTSESLDDEHVFESIMSQCELIAERLGVHTLVAFMLLESQNWNIHRLYEHWPSLSATMLNSIGITRECAMIDPSLKHPVLDESEMTCGICWEDMAKEDAWCLPCGHTFCTECWKNQVAVHIARGHHQVPCQEEGCRCKIPPTSVKELCGTDVYNNLMRFLMDQQISLADTLTNCPNPPCAKPIDVLTTSICNVLKCTHCCHEFCTECKEVSHAPASCSEKQRWETSTGDDVMKQRLFGPNVKTCPNCKSIIEKNGGCNHMTCFKCRHEFCWMCMVTWSSHAKDFYNCKTYRPENDPFLKKPDNISKEFLARYHDTFIQIDLQNKSLKDKMPMYVKTIATKINRMDKGRTYGDITVVVKKFTDELYWANENLRWAQVQMFCDRWEQVKDLDPARQLDMRNPPLTPQQNLFEFSRKQLHDIVQLSSNRLNEYVSDVMVPNIMDLVALTKRMHLAREVLLKQRDPHYNQS